jgi:hypothetical protein
VNSRRTALIIASDDYEHPGLSRLRAPAADAQALANVLGDKEVGEFRVQVVHNAPSHIVQGHIEDLFADSQSDDLVLLHFSGHGLKSDSGELFFATRNTRPDRLASTAVPADFVQRCMRTSRARSIVLFLDCCYGGAFGQGVTVRAAGSANVLESFPAGRLGGGRGRAVITASSAMEYAFEGDNLADEHQQRPSIFTAALVDGLSTGEADADEDGLVSLNELYDYVFDRVRERNPKQTPSRDVELQGELYLARSQRRRLRALPIPGEVAAALRDENMFTRLGAVAELRARMSATDLGAALGAYEALVEVARSDIRYVQDAATEATSGVLPAPSPSALDFGIVSEAELPAAQTIRLGGPPLAGAVKVSASDAWVVGTAQPDGVHVSIHPTQIGSLSASVTITGPTGQVVVPVTVHVVGAPVEQVEQVEQAEQGAQAARQATPEPTPAAPAPTPVHVATPGVSRAGRSEADPATGQSGAAELRAAGPTVPEPKPADGIAAAVPRLGASGAQPGRPLWKASAMAALASGILMLLCVLLPLQYGEATYSRDRIKAVYLFVLAVVVLVEAVTLLATRRRIQALGAVIGSATVGTVVGFDMVNTLNRDGTSELGPGFWSGLLAPVVLIAAGLLAVAAARREAEPGFAAPASSDWATWVVLVLAVAGALTLLPPALETYSSSKGWGAQGLWGAFLAVATPLTAVLVRPAALGRWMLVGGALAGAAPVLALWMWWQHNQGTSFNMWFVELTLAAIAGLAPLVHRTRGQPAHHAGPESGAADAGA